MPDPILIRIALTACLLFSSGCSIMQARPVSERVYTFTDDSQYVDVAYGQPTGLVAKAISVKANFAAKIPHEISSRIPGLLAPDASLTEQSVAHSVDYLARNGIQKTKVRVNQYEPGEEFQRLRENEKIALPLRYTLGMVSLAKYTLAPGQLTQSDSYNPYTDTLNLNSGNAAIAIEQAAHAKDLKRRKMPQLYLLSKKIPCGELPAIAYTKNEVVNYYAMYGTAEQQQQATDVMIPRLASQIGGEVSELIPGTGPTLAIAGKMIGKAIVHQPWKRLAK